MFMNPVLYLFMLFMLQSPCFLSTYENVEYTVSYIEKEPA
jgi:hypothetical protein